MANLLVQSQGVHKMAQFQPRSQDYLGCDVLELFVSCQQPIRTGNSTHRSLLSKIHFLELPFVELRKPNITFCSYLKSSSDAKTPEPGTNW